MKLFNELDGNNFVLFAAKHYHNRQCQDADEFYDDLNKFKYIKKQVNRFLKNDDDNDRVFRLIKNHVIIIYNVFDIEAAHRMMAYKLEEEQLTVIKPILLGLGFITTKDFIDIPLNQKAVEQCRKK